MPTLPTRKQEQLLKYIQQYIAQRGWPPTFRELARHFSVSLGAIQDRVAALEAKGRLKRSDSQARGFEPVDHPFRFAILGRVGAGGGMIAQEDIEGHFSFKDFTLGTDFILRVKGDSMIGENIVEGDLLQVRRQPTAEDGDIVVAVVGEEGVVKRLKRRGRAFRLESANPKYAPITVDFQVIGKVLGLMRRYGRGRD